MKTTECGHKFDPFTHTEDGYQLGSNANQPWTCTRNTNHAGSHYCFRAAGHLSIWDDDGWIDVHQASDNFDSIQA